MRHYKPYPKYKSSGIDWIGEVPEHWNSRKVAWDMKMTIGWTPSTKNSRYYGGSYNWVSIADLTSGKINETKQKITQLAVDEMKGTQAPAGSLLFSYKLTIGKVALLDEPAFTNEAIAAFYPNTTIDMTYWKYASIIILPKYSRKNIYDSDLLNQELMNSARFFAPIVEEQKQITDFLDKETISIDTLISQKNIFIELLKEKNQTLIIHAITKGIDPNVKMKDSGVEWIGEVPEHWNSRKVAWDMKMTIGWTPSTKNSRYYGGSYNWVSIADLTSGKINETKQKITQLAVNEMKGTQAPAGSLLFSYKLTIGKVALLDEPAFTNEAIAAFYPNTNIDMTFWKYASTIILPKYSRKNIYDSDLLNQELMNSARFFAPIIEEQKQIADFLDYETKRIDTLIEKTQQSISLIKERRLAFITAAVTGQIDLREE